MFGITMAEVQSHVDKKLSVFFNNVSQMFASKKQVQSLQSQLDVTKDRLSKLCAYLGVEYSETCTKGFAKVKKKKAK